MPPSAHHGLAVGESGGGSPNLSIAIACHSRHQGIVSSNLSAQGFDLGNSVMEQPMRPSHLGVRPAIAGGF